MSPITLAFGRRTGPPQQVDRLARVLYDRSDAHGLDPELVLAVITVESSFRFRARSPVGALGLMQVMPSTGRLHARSSGVRWRGARTLYDPAANIRIGTRYLAWLIRKFDGDLALALTSYCHGIGRVKRTLRSQGRLSYRRLRYSRRVLRQLASLRRARAKRKVIVHRDYYYDRRSTKRYAGAVRGHSHHRVRTLHRGPS